jgi:hypothetical protein
MEIKGNIKKEDRELLKNYKIYIYTKQNTKDTGLYITGEAHIKKIDLSFQID